MPIKKTRDPTTRHSNRELVSIKDRIRVLWGTLQFPHHRLVLSCPAGRTRRGGVWNRRWSYHSPVHCCYVRLAYSHDSRCYADGDLCDICRRCHLLFSLWAVLRPIRSCSLPDWALGLLFGIGGFVGMYLGASAQKYVPGRVLRPLLAIVITAVGLQYILAYVL